MFTPWKCFSKLIHLRYHVWASQNAVKGNRYYRLSPHLTSEKTTSRNLRSTATEQRGQHGSHLPPCRAWPWLQPARTAGRFQRRGPLSSPGNWGLALTSFLQWRQTQRFTRRATPSRGHSTPAGGRPARPRQRARLSQTVLLRGQSQDPQSLSREMGSCTLSTHHCISTAVRCSVRDL